MNSSKKNLRNSDNRIHRGADFMAHIGQEGRLRLIGILCRFLHHLKFLHGLMELCRIKKHDQISDNTTISRTDTIHTSLKNLSLHLKRPVKLVQIQTLFFLIKLVQLLIPDWAEKVCRILITVNYHSEVICDNYNLVQTITHLSDSQLINLIGTALKQNNRKGCKGHSKYHRIKVIL